MSATKASSWEILIVSCREQITAWCAAKEEAIKANDREHAKHCNGKIGYLKDEILKYQRRERERAAGIENELQ